MKRFLLSIALLFIASGLGLAWFVPRAWFWVGSESTAGVSVTIESGWGVARTAEVLRDAGIIDSSFGYEMYAKVSALATLPKVGTYALKPHSSYQTVARILALGPPKNEVQLTIPEGWSIAEITRALAPYDATVPALIPDELRQAYPFLADLASDATLEGFLFPETYRVYADQLPQALLRKQLNQFAIRAPAIQEATVAAKMSLHELVTLASIVEKEVAKPADRKMVAGIFLNRLRIGMPLQSDATVNYITNAGRARPTLDDLDAVSPYNTYRNRGLPPGPISNPGDSAIEAVIQPTVSDNLYFLTDAEGALYVASSFEGHQRNRVRAFGQ